MYVLNKYSVSSKLVENIHYATTKDLIKDYFHHYIELFCSKNTNLNTEFSYRLTNGYKVCVLTKKSHLISRGYLWDTVTCIIEDIAYFSICHHTGFKNLNIDLIKVNRTAEEVSRNYYAVMQELKNKLGLNPS